MHDPWPEERKDEEKHDRANDGHDEAADEAIGGDSQVIEEKSSQHGAEDPDHDVPKEAEPTAARELSRNPPCQRSDDEEPEKSHTVGLLNELILLL